MQRTSHHRAGKGLRARLRRHGAAAGLPAGEEPAPSFTAIDAYIRAQMKDARIPGLALGIVHDGQPVHLRGFGRADDSGRAFTPQTPFFIGSCSKSFTALAVMQLAEAGRVDLDAPVQRYIPWFRVADPEASALITVRHLLNQTSGLTERAGRGATLAAGMHPLEPAVRALATTGLARPPGTAFEYSNLNYTTLGLVVEMAAGEPFDAYLKAHIFEPLNMHHTYTAIEDARRDGLASGYRYWFGFPAAFGTPGHGGTVPTAGIISTAEDMSRYLAMYQGGGGYHGQVVLSPAGIAEMMQPGPPQKRGLFAGAGYGMGWFTGPWGGVDASYHPGDEPNAHAGMVLVPQGNWGVVVLFNVGLHGGALPGLLAIEQSVTGMVAGGTVRDTGVGAFYAGFDAAVAAERPLGTRSDRVFVVLKGPRRGQPLSVRGMDEILAAARRRAGLEHATCHELRHTCLTRLREAGMALEAVQAQAGHASIESTRICLHLADDWLAAQYRKAAEVIDAQIFAGHLAGAAAPAGRPW
jgi:CubicO group peptidase (beta-lactamase class C family)